MSDEDRCFVASDFMSDEKTSHTCLPSLPVRPPARGQAFLSASRMRQAGARRQVEATGRQVATLQAKKTLPSRMQGSTYPPQLSQPTTCTGLVADLLALSSSITVSVT